MEWAEQTCMHSFTHPSVMSRVEGGKMTKEGELPSCLLSAWTLAKLHSLSEWQLNCKNRNHSTWPTFYLHRDDNIKRNGNSLRPGRIREQSPTKVWTHHKYKLCSLHKTCPTCPQLSSLLEDKELPCMAAADLSCTKRVILLPINKHDYSWVFSHCQPENVHV